jgi:hypothetical protein
MVRAAAAPTPPDIESRATARKLLVLTLLAVAFRLAFLALEPATHPAGDERTWTDWAKHLVSEKVGLSPFRTRMIFHPPLYAYFLALPLKLFGSLEAAKWIQAVLASLLVPAVGRAGCRVFGSRVGVLAAGFVAFYPELVWFSVHFWVETVFLVLVWWSLERLLASDATDRVAPAIASGLLFGLAVLARETILYFLPLAAVWLARSSRGRNSVKRALIFVGVALATVAPWTWRNWRVFHAFVPVSTAGGLALFQGNAHLTRQEVYDRYEAVQGRVEQYRYAQRMGLEAIRERQPTWFFEKLAEQMPMFWEAESMAVIHVKRGAYGQASLATARWVGLVMLLPYLALLVLFVAGIASLPLKRETFLLVMFLVYYNLIHVATHGFNRYRLPVMPVVFLIAASAWCTWRAGELRLSVRRKLCAAAVGLVLALSVLPSLGRQWTHQAFGLTHFEEGAAEAPPE